MEFMKEHTLSHIALQNQDAIPVFEKYGLDFCCNGNTRLDIACSKKNLSVDDIIREIETSSYPETYVMPFAEMTTSQLIGHILTHHHFYVRKQMPRINEHLRTIVAFHGDHYPFLHELKDLFSLLSTEMTEHMHKEEAVIFPAIIELEKQLETGKQKDEQQNSQVDTEDLEDEHAHAGEILEKIRTITGNYNAPGDACMTFTRTYAELKAFEEDLHIHVHLENNILFPVSIRLSAV
jgi:regulator of cell morphogenesis and NO signaling